MTIRDCHFFAALHGMQVDERRCVHSNIWLSCVYCVCFETNFIFRVAKLEKLRFSKLMLQHNARRNVPKGQNIDSQLDSGSGLGFFFKQLSHRIS